MKRLTAKQILIISKMREGYEIFVGISDFSGRQYQYISFGFHNIEIRADVFGRLISDGLIYQRNSRPFDWILTKLGETCELKYKHKKQ